MVEALMRAIAAAAVIVVLATPALAQDVASIVTVEIQPFTEPEGVRQGETTQAVIEYCYGTPGAVALSDTTIHLDASADPPTASVSVSPTTLSVRPVVTLNGTTSCAPKAYVDVTARASNGLRSVTVTARANPNPPIGDSEGEHTLVVWMRYGGANPAPSTDSGPTATAPPATEDEGAPLFAALLFAGVLGGVTLLWRRR